MSHFPCPNCGAARTRVTQTNDWDRGLTRRRKCYECKRIFDTIELPIPRERMAITELRKQLLDNFNATARSLNVLREEVMQLVKENRKP